MFVLIRAHNLNIDGTHACTIRDGVPLTSALRIGIDAVGYDNSAEPQVVFTHRLRSSVSLTRNLDAHISQRLFQ